MQVDIAHRITYRYSRPVFLEPHVLRVRSRADGVQRVDSFALECVPQPAGRTEAVDPDGNAASWIWYSDQTESLTVQATSRVRTLRTNPFDFIIVGAGVLRVPAVYPTWLNSRLAPYIARPQADRDVDALAETVARKADGDCLSFLRALTDDIASTFTFEIRPEGMPNAPSETLATHRGACRDLTVLFMDACRAMGLAARFVSGYAVDGGPDGEHSLHAWAEVYLPGAGWRGFDPTLGLAVADRHIALAASVEAAGAAPVTGTFRGTGATSELSATVSIASEES